MHTMLAQGQVDVLAPLLLFFGGEPDPTVARVVVDSIERKNDPLERAKDLFVGGHLKPTHPSFRPRRRAHPCHPVTPILGGLFAMARRYAEALTALPSG
ncbi:hypothetical protein ABZ957_09600 [Streptomyces sp. NPDC046316]|uniref:hypothetical protein n=1 Tax=Streptomyces sp. NPDC046316 TaxID=3154494 RepID=UPI00340E3D19